MLAFCSGHSLHAKELKNKYWSYDPLGLKNDLTVILIL